METINKEVKTLLAKLLATEDIHVVHKNMPTAYFDTKNRELGLPILKDMSGDIYDLMTLHEVGHALWTNPEEWIELINADNDDELPKSFINVAEDVRIERKIKDKYPGGRKAFKTGYDKLYSDNFFGTASRDISESNLADRINLHSKIGDTTGLVFEGEELEIYNLCKKAVTFKDAVDAARAMYAYCKDNEKFEGSDEDTHSMMAPFWDEDGDMDEDDENSMGGKSLMDGYEDYEDEEENGESSPEEPGDEKPTGESESDNVSERSENETDEDEDDPIDAPKELKREGGFGMGETTNPMQASTVLEWEERKRDLNTDDGKEYWYASVPESNYNSIINYKKLLKHCEKHYSSSYVEPRFMDGVYKYMSAFEKESMKTVSYMLKEFEMKKSADAYVRSSIAKTGVLDMSKMYSYKYNDDLFKKITIMPGEKNHGLIILVDWSGSMHHIIHDAFKQLMQLVWFCRRAGIKFEVFAFSDAALGSFEGSKSFDWNDRDDYYKNEYWNFKLGDMAMSDHLLLNLFSDRMSKAETKKMTINIAATTMSINRHHWRTESSDNFFETYVDGWDSKTENIWKFIPMIPDGLNLGGTPLNAAVVNLMTFVPKYRKAKGIQNLNIIVITDGASNSDGGKLIEHPETKHWMTEFAPYRRIRDRSSCVHFLTDPVTKKNYKVRGRANVDFTVTYLEMLKDRTGCNVIGFYLANSTKNGALRPNDLNWLFPNQDLDAVRAEVRKNKMAVAKSFGYDEYFVIPTGNMSTDADELLVDSSMTKGRMAKAFTKHMRSKIINRVLLNKIIEKVA